MTRLLQAALAAAFFWAVLLMTGLACYGDEGLEKGEVVASASVCPAPEVAHAIARILETSADRKEANRLLFPFFNGPTSPCLIFPSPVPIIVEDVLEAGIDFEGTTFYIVRFTPTPGKPLYFIFFDLPGLRKDMAL